MKRRTGLAAILFLLAFFLFVPVKADAAWVKNSNGTYSWYNKSGKKLSSQWFAEKQVGFVTSGSTTYCYKLDGSLYKGWLTVGSSKYYITSKGVLLKSKWILSGGKKYYASKTGKIYKNCIVKIGSYYYGFNSSGVMQTGKATIKDKTYYFYKKTGRMLKKAFVTIDGKKYYFGSNGVMGCKVWVNNYYVNASGYVATNIWAGSKYVGADGHPVKGLQEIDGKYYYFNTSTYNKVTSTTKTVNGVKYIFDKDGVGKIASQINETTIPSVAVEDTYYTDPLVSEETLLSAIIYCEAGNQPYYGQVAVGMVIINRMRSSSFPSRMKEVIYQKVQFSPTFDGALTRALKNQSLITASCKKAAAEVMSRYKANNYTITVTETQDGKETSKQLDLKSYLFFMTKPAYDRLKLASPYVKLGDHVFFKTWKYA